VAAVIAEGMARLSRPGWLVKIPRWDPLKKTVLLTGPTDTQNSLFCVLAVAVIIAVLIAPTHGGMARLSWPGWFGYITGWYAIKDIFVKCDFVKFAADNRDEVGL